MEENKPVESKDNFSLDQIVNIKDLQDNSIIVFRVKELNEGVYDTIEKLQGMYGNLFTEKSVSFMILKPDTNLELVNPDRMKKMGWIKEKKNLIISNYA